MNGRPRQQPAALGRRLASTTALCAGLWALAAAPASAVTPEEADALRADIEAFLADPASSSMEWIGQGFSFRSGAVSVEAAGDTFEILIPGLVVVHDEPEGQLTRDDPAHVEITLGDLHATMTPDPASEDLSAVAAHFGDGGPVTITVAPDDPGDGAMIEIGSHRVDGVWSSAIGYFVDGGFAFEDVVATSVSGEAGGPPDHRIAIGLLSSTSEMTEVEPDLWDGAFDFVIENLAADDQGEAVFTLQRLELFETVGGFAFAEYLDYVASHPIISGVVPEGTSEEEGAEMVREALMDLPTILDDFTIGWTLDGLEVTEDEHVAIGHHEFELGASGLAGDVSSWHLRAMVTDVTTPPDPQMPPQFIPTLFDLNLTFDNVPTGLAWQAAEQTVATTPLESLDDVGPLLAQQLLGLVMEAQTGMTIGGEVDWEVGNVSLDGEVHADPASPMMMGGRLAIVVREIQEFIDEVDATMGPEAASGLTLMRSMGQEDEDDQGPITVFEFVIEGTNVLMNGQDLEPIVRMLSR